MGLAAAVTVGAAMAAAGPAAAHGTTTTTTTAPAAAATAGAGLSGVPSMTGMSGMSGMGGMGGMGGSPLGAAATVDAGGAGGGGEPGLWLGLVVALAVTALATAGLVALRRRRAGDTQLRALDLVGAAALVFAGVAHCALTPSHWAEGWHLGAFFAASGLLLVAQGALLGLRPSTFAYGSVVASTTVLVALYFLAREVALPLVGHQDPYLLEDVPVKLAEVAAALAAGVALVRARAFSGRPLGAHPAVVPAS